MENNKLIIIDENNQEKEMEILFTFDTDEENKYVIYFDPNNDDECFAAKYNENGELFPDLTEEEWDMCLEMVNTFMVDDNEEEA